MRCCTLILAALIVITAIPALANPASGAAPVVAPDTGIAEHSSHVVRFIGRSHASTDVVLARCNRPLEPLA